MAQSSGTRAQFNRNIQSLLEYFMKEGLMEKEFAGRRGLLEQERKGQGEYIEKQSEAWSRNTREQIAGQLEVIGQQFVNEASNKAPVKSYTAQALKAEMEGDVAKAEALKLKAQEHIRRTAAPLRKLFPSTVVPGVDIEGLIENWSQEGVQNALLARQSEIEQGRTIAENAKDRVVRGEAVVTERIKALTDYDKLGQETSEKSLTRFEKMATDLIDVLQDAEKSKSLIPKLPEDRRGQLLTEISKVRSSIAQGNMPTGGQRRILENYWNPAMMKTGAKRTEGWDLPLAEEGGLFEPELAAVSDDILMKKIRAKVAGMENKPPESAIQYVYQWLKKNAAVR